MPENSEILSTSLHLVAPVWVVAVVNGVFFTKYPFFGGCLALFLIYVVFRQTNDILTTKEVSIKKAELVSVTCFIPLLSAISAISYLFIPLSEVSLNFLLIASVPPHLAVIWKMSNQLNHFVLFTSSSTLLAISVLEIWFIPRSFIAMSILAAYALTILCQSIYLLRESVPLALLKNAVFLLLIICLIEWILKYLRYGTLFEAKDIRLPGLLMETTACLLLYVFLDFLEFETRYYFSLLSRSSTTRLAIFHLLSKLTVLWVLAMWAGLATISNWHIDAGPVYDSYNTQKADERKEQSLQSTHFNAYKKKLDRQKTEESWRRGCQAIEVGAMSLYVIALIAAHGCHFAAKSRARMKDRLWPTERDKKTTIGLAAAAAVVVMMICIAAYYILAPRPLDVSSTHLLLIIGTLYLTLTILLDWIRAYLAPSNTGLGYIFLNIVVVATIPVIILEVAAPGRTWGENGFPVPVEDSIQERVRRIARVVLLLIFLLYVEFCNLSEELLKRWAGPTVRRSGRETPEIVLRLPDEN